MKILALEFSSSQRSVAFMDAQVDGLVFYAGEVVRSGGRSTPAFAMIEEVLDHAGIEREAVECLAIGLGPGSYHGIRVAISVAQGWQLARETRLLGLSSAEAIAAQAHADGVRGPVMVMVDAQRDEVYVADFALSDAGWRETKPLRLASVQQATTERQDDTVILGPEVTRWFPKGHPLFPRAATLGRLAANRLDFIAGEKLEPIYLRATSFVKAQPAATLARAL